MPYRCERCGRDWADRDAADNGLRCLRGCGGALRPAGHDGTMADLVGVLPHPLAVVLREYLGEANDYVRLHRLCDAAEMLTRFLATVALAEVAGGPGGTPEPLRNALLDGIELPTFGKWAAILRAALAALPAPDARLVPELEGLGRRVLEALGSGRDLADRAVLRLRNEVAHSRVGPGKVRDLLAIHGPRFDSLWRHESAAFLPELELLGVADGGSCLLLRGAPDPPANFSAYDAGRLPAAGAGPPPWAAGTVLLTRPGLDRFLVLFPLQVFAPVRHQVGERLEQVTPDPAAQVYARNDRLVQYTAFHPREGHSDGTAAMRAAFDALFPLKDWRDAVREAGEAEAADAAVRAAAREFAFRDTVEPLLRESFVGRDRQVTDALVWLDRHPAGVGLVLGQPGVGKSAFLARLSAEVRRQNRDWLCLRHFFRVGDDRCSARKFMAGVLLQLQLAGGTHTELPADDAAARETFLDALDEFSREHLGEGRRHARLVLLLDGLDEVAQRDPEFFALVRGRRLERVAWLCTARPEPAMLAGLPEPAMLAGLPPLDRQAVRQYLVEQLDRRRYELLGEESDDGACRFLDALADEARCLPLYLHLLVGDMRRGEFDPGQPEKLPKDLTAYYDRLTDRLALDAARKVLPDVIALLAVAHTPLTDGMLANLLQDYDLRGDPEWGQVFSSALRLGHAVMKAGYLWDGTAGHTLYHNSYRNYLLGGEGESYARFRMAPVLRQARRRLRAYCLRWADWPAGSDDRRYALEYGVWHCRQEGDLAGLAALVDGGYLEAQAELFGDVRALADARDTVTALGDAEGFWDAAVRAAERYCTLAERSRNDPSALGHLASRGEFDRVRLILESEPDLTRRAVMGLAASELAANDFARPAGDLRAESLPTVERSLRTLPPKTRCLATRLIEPDEAPAFPPPDPATVPPAVAGSAGLPPRAAEDLPAGAVVAAYAARWTTLVFPLVTGILLWTGGGLSVVTAMKLVPAFREILTEGSTLDMLTMCWMWFWPAFGVYAAAYFGLTQILRARRGRWERRFALWEAAFTAADEPRRLALLGQAMRLHAVLGAGRIGGCGAGPVCRMLAEQFSQSSDEECALLLSLAHQSDEAVRRRAAKLLSREPPGRRYAVVRALLAADLRPVRWWWFLFLNFVPSRSTPWFDEQYYHYCGDGWLFFQTLAATSSEAAYPADVLCDAFAMAPHPAEQPDEVERAIAETVQLVHAVPRERTAEVLLLTLRPPAPAPRAVGPVIRLTPPVVKWPLGRCETAIRVAESVTGWTLGGLGVVGMLAFLLWLVFYIAGAAATMIACIGLVVLIIGFDDFIRLRQAIDAQVNFTSKLEILLGAIDEPLELLSPTARASLRGTALASLILHPKERNHERLARFSQKEMQSTMRTLIRHRRLRPGADLLRLVMADRRLLNAAAQLPPPDDAGFYPPTEDDHLRQLRRCLPTLTPLAQAAIVLTLSAAVALLYSGAFAVLGSDVPVERRPSLLSFLVVSSFLAVWVQLPLHLFGRPGRVALSRGTWNGLSAVLKGIAGAGLWALCIYALLVCALPTRPVEAAFLDCYWLPAVTAGLLVPWAVELWRGANLLYPTARRVAIQRLTVVACGVALAVGAAGLHVVLVNNEPALRSLIPK